MVETDYWVRDNFMDKVRERNWVGLAAQFLLRVEAGDPVGPETNFVSSALGWTRDATLDLATRVLELPDASLFDRCYAAEIALVLSSLTIENPPPEKVLISLLRTDVAGHSDAVIVAHLVRTLAVHAWDCRRVRIAGVKALKGCSKAVDLDLPEPKRATRRAIVELYEQILARYIAIDKELATVYEALSR